MLGTLLFVAHSINTQNGTDGRPIIRKQTSVTGRHNPPLFLFPMPLYSFYSLRIQERIFQVASTTLGCRTGGSFFVYVVDGTISVETRYPSLYGTLYPSVRIALTGQMNRYICRTRSRLNEQTACSRVPPVA